MPIVHNSDEHVGNVLADEELMAATIKRVAGDPDCYWVSTGDRLELIAPNDPRFEAGKAPPWFTFEMLADPAEAQIARYTELYKPIAHKCLATVQGNHEWDELKYSSRDVYHDLDRRLGIPAARSLGLSGFLRLRFVSTGDKVVWRPVVYLFHGSGSASSVSSVINRLRRQATIYTADVYCMGHYHIRAGAEDVRYSMDDATGEIVRTNVRYSGAGGYLLVSTDGDGGYAERKGLLPHVTGPNELHFYPNRKEIRVLS